MPHPGSTIVGIHGVTAAITILGVMVMDIILGIPDMDTAGAVIITHGILHITVMAMVIMAIDIITVITETATTAAMATTATHTTEAEAEEVIITPIQLPAIAQQEI